MALLMIGLSLICDFLDGMVARALKVDSPLGVQLDSLADMVSFGVVPGFVLYQLILQYSPLEGFRHSILPYMGLLVALASAMRLARFNLDEGQKHHFVGLPTPSSAIFVMGLPYLIAYINRELPGLNPDWGLTLAVLSLILAYSLNAPMALFSFKTSGNDAFKWQKFVFLALSALLLFTLKLQALSLIILLYVLFSLVLFNPKKSIEP